MRTTIIRIGAGLKKMKWVLVVALVAAVAAAMLMGGYGGGKASASDYITARVERGTVETTVSATGTLQAVTTVQVGSQASGTVAWLGADFNSRVSRGQIIARLDPTTAQAQVDSARASVLSAEAAVQAAESEVNSQRAGLNAAAANLEATRVQSRDAADVARRNEQLAEVVARRDIEAAKAQANLASARTTQADAQVAQTRTGIASAQAKVAQAKAQLAGANAQLEQALANIKHTEIVSPVDGVVVSRSVDLGQTVAASLQAPTLFTIAADLNKMQVLASIDEADVGPIREGQAARFTVDAFPGATFDGRVSQVRLGAQTVQNVVTYTAVIDVDNPGQKLMPGMTASITIPVEHRENVLVVPNSALRFKPDAAAQQAGATARTSSGQRDAAGQGDGGRRGPRVYVVAGDGTLQARQIKTGLTDGRVTEILDGSEVEEGDAVVTGVGSDDAKPGTKQQTGSPFTPRMGGRSTQRGGTR